MATIRPTKSDVTSDLAVLLERRRGWQNEADTNRFGLAHKAKEKIAELDVKIEYCSLQGEE